MSTIRSEREIKKYINAILISGFIVALIGIIQFILVSILGIVEPGTSIDFANKYSIHRSMRLGFYRATSVLACDNELGIFLSTCLVFIFVFNYCLPEYRKKHYKKLVFSIIIMLVALLFSMSRSAMIAFAASILAISFLEKRKKMVVTTSLAIVVLSLLLPVSIKLLFKPVFTFSDLYFSTWKREDLWGSFLQSPLMGHGFSITRSTAEKLGITQLGTVGIGGADIDFFKTSIQIGLIGYLLHFFIWFLFLRNSFLSAKSEFISKSLRALSLAIFGILVGLRVASLHIYPWDYVSLAGTYYILGAISTFIYHQADKKGRSSKKRILRYGKSNF